MRFVSSHYLKPRVFLECYLVRANGTKWNYSEGTAVGSLRESA